MTENPRLNSSFDRICRLCIQEKLDLKPIFDSSSIQSIPNLIKACVDVQVQPIDKLPKNVCNSCVEKMMDWECFKNTCQESEDFLLNQLKIDENFSSKDELLPLTADEETAFALIKEEELSDGSGDESCQLLQNENSPASDNVIITEENVKVLESEKSFVEVNKSLETPSNECSQTTAENIQILADESSKALADESLQTLDNESSLIPIENLSENNLSSVIKVSGLDVFKILLETQFISDDRNLYKSVDNEDHFACTEKFVIRQENNLLLEVAENTFCPVQFVIDGKSINHKNSVGKPDNSIETESEITPKPSIEKVKEKLEHTKTIYFHVPDENQVISNEGALSNENVEANSSPVDYGPIVILTEGNVDENTFFDDLQKSIIMSKEEKVSDVPILNTPEKSKTKEVLKFHKYAKPRGEKAVKFIIPEDELKKVNEPPVSEAFISKATEKLVDKPTNCGLRRSRRKEKLTEIRQEEIDCKEAKPVEIRPKGTKLKEIRPKIVNKPFVFFSTPGILTPVKKSEIINIAGKKRLARRKAAIANMQPAKPQALVKLTSEISSPKTESSVTANSDDISARIQKIIENNEAVLQNSKMPRSYTKLFGPGLYESDDHLDLDKAMEAVKLKKMSVRKAAETFSVSKSSLHRWLNYSKTTLSSGEEEVNLKTNPPPPVIQNPITNMEQLENSIKEQRKVLKQTTKKQIPTLLKKRKKMSSTKKASNLIKASISEELQKCSSTNNELVIETIKYTINEEGLKVPIIFVNTAIGPTQSDLNQNSFGSADSSVSLNSSVPVSNFMPVANSVPVSSPMPVNILKRKRDWKKEAMKKRVVDPALLPKNNQRSKILQKFYLPKEPLIGNEVADSEMEEGLNPDEELALNDKAEKLREPSESTTGNQKDGESKENDHEYYKIKAKRVRKRKPGKWRKKRKPKIYKCNLCDSAFVKFYELLGHDRLVHPDVPWNDACTVCGKSYISEERVKWHSNIYHAEKNVFCDLCGHGFSTIERLKNHLRSHNDKFICKECGFRASSSGKLLEHSRIHTGDKPFICEVCGAQLCSKFSLKQHSRKHNGEQRQLWTCKDCGYSTRCMTSFYNHRLIHRTSDSLLCEICGKSVLTKSRLLKHLKYAHGPRTKGHYLCSECNGIFFTRLDCEKHLKEKHSIDKKTTPINEISSFVCKICLKCFSKKSACDKHFESHKAVPE